MSHRSKWPHPRAPADGPPARVRHREYAIMSLQNATTLADLGMRLGLLTPSQVDEAWDKLGGRNAQPDDFVRIMERQGYLTPFQSAKLVKGDKDGYALGGYRLRYKIASGTFGRVYRADDPHTGRVLAVKV